MAMTVSAIRFAPEEKERIEAFAKMSGKSFSAQVREWMLERLEDELDARDLKSAIVEDDGTRYTIDEVFSKMGGIARPIKYFLQEKPLRLRVGVQTFNL